MGLSPLRSVVLATITAGLWLVLGVRQVHAQSTPNAIARDNGGGFDTHLFRPAYDSRGLLSVNGVDVLGDGRFSVGLVMDYGRGILRVPDVGQKSTTLIDNSFTGTFHFNYGISQRLVIGLAAPVVLMSGEEQLRPAGTTPAVAGWGPQALDVQSMQHVALHAKLRLLPSHRPIGLAIGAQVGVPVSDAAKNAGADPSVWYWPTLIAEKRFGVNGQVKIAANVGYRGHSSSSTTLALDGGRFRDGSRLTYGLGGSVRVFDPVDVVLETYGSYLLSDSAASVKPSNEVLGGVKVFIEQSSYLVIGAGPRYTSGFEAADLRAMVGFIFEPPVGDVDGDGVKDDVDRCPRTPGLFSTDGCPLDTDGDGIPDVEDACPLVKGVRTNDPRTNGCPPDRDLDGVPDSEDACPDVPGVRTRDPKTNGCPETPDRDRDGVPDAQDACPDLPGEKHPEDLTRHGCPDIIIGDREMIVFDKIHFRTASAEILPESNPVLDNVAKVLNGHPELSLMEVAGHADERGAEQLNLQLTQARVDSVMAALAQRNVAANRLRAKGYGFYCPRSDGHDEESWSKNRRVEFIIVKKDGKPTGAELGCANAEAHGVKPAPVP